MEEGRPHSFTCPTPFISTRNIFPLHPIVNSFSSITGGVSRTFWVSKKSPLLAVGAISWKPKTSAKPLQLYYLVIRLVIRQSCTHTPVSRVRTPPSCRSIYRCLELHKLRATPESLPNWRNATQGYLPGPWMLL